MTEKKVMPKAPPLKERLIVEYDDELRKLQKELNDLTTSIQQNQQFIDNQRIRANQLFGERQALQRMREQLINKK